MKKLLAVLLVGASTLGQAQTFPVNNLLVTGSLTATGLVTTTDLATQLANTVLGNGGATTASPTALPMPSCSTLGTVLQWTSGQGFTCGAVVLSQTSTGQVFQNLGARINRMNDKLFVGTATLNDGNSNQLVGDWTFNEYSVAGVGAFAYLEHNGTLNVGSPNGQPAFIAATRSSDAGGAGDAAIGISSVVVNDNAIGAGGDSWGFYGTTVRAAGATGQSTLGMELEVANLGATVPLFPNAMFANGLSADLWLGAGGELPFQSGGSYTFGNNSAAIGIFANTNGSTPVYDKGIIFSSNALNSNGYAINFPINDKLAWWNSSNQLTGAISAQATTVATGQQLILSPIGTVVQDMSGNIQFIVGNGTTSAADYLGVSAAAAGGSPTLSANGSDTNIPITIKPKGSGVIFLQALAVLGHFTVGALPTCTGPLQGAMAYVSDANAPTYNAAVAGGGTVSIPVFCTGGTWTAH